MNQAETISVDTWTFFDKIYCISLANRSDRREQAKKQFAAVGLLPRVEFVIVTKDQQNPEKGIFQSHMVCLNKGLTANARNILIFEDDVFFEKFDAHVLHETWRNLQSVANWNAFFLGCITDGSRKTSHKNLMKISYRCLAHAYVLHRSFAARIAHKTWSGIPFDELLRRHNEDFYALYPMCAFQGLASSDNQTVVIDRMRRILGGLPFIQKANELYQNNKVALLLAASAVPVVFVIFSLQVVVNKWSTTVSSSLFLWLLLF